MQQSTEKKTLNSIARELLDWAESFMTSLALMLIILTFFIGNVQVYGRSMNPTLESGERLFINQIYQQLNYGDIVVIHRKDDQPIIKRVIATAGQTVDIDFDLSIVYVDGQPLEEPYLEESTLFNRYDYISFPVTIPPDHLFVMGDNRNNSEDSRYQGLGPVKQEDVFGKVILRFFPFKRFGVIPIQNTPERSI